MLEVADHRFTALLSERRRALAADARGRVLDVSGGQGAELRPDGYRSQSVTEVVAIGSSGAGGAAGLEESDFPAGSFDTVVTSWVFCRLADPEATAAAIVRWLKPDGSLLFLEHVRGVGVRARAQRALTPLWLRVAGCELDRDTIGTLRRAGLAVTDCERFAVPARGPLFRTCVQGVARPRPLQGYRSPRDGEWHRP
jgi:SAM-dependent methyltransferase